MAHPLLERNNPSEALPILEAARAMAAVQSQLQWTRWQPTSTALDADMNGLRSPMNPMRDGARGFNATAPWFAQ